MSETPETDAFFFRIDIDWDMEVEFARKLERERDEAQDALTTIYRWIERNHADGFIDSLTYSQNLERFTDNWYDRLERVERERDEAMEKNAKLRDIAEAAIDWLKLGNPDDKRAAGHIRAELDRLKEGTK